MNKKDIILKVSDTLEWLEGMDAAFSVSAWDKKTGWMVDDHVTELFPELERTGLEEEQEGDMYFYFHNCTKEKMMEMLRDMGFTVELFTGKNFSE
jgi:3'-phosphoadenosine 5'-phosphosulfate sulfotransferase